MNLGFVRQYYNRGYRGHTIRYRRQIGRSHACEGNIVVFNLNMLVFALNAIYETCNLGIMRERQENEYKLLFLRRCFSHCCWLDVDDDLELGIEGK